MGPRPDNTSGDRQRRGRGLIPWVVAVLALVITAVPAGAGGLVPNPANHRKLVNRPMDEARYDHARKCRSKPTRGAKRLVRWLDRTVRGESWGINRCERLKAGGNFSIHSEGRAVDWRLDAGKRKERRSAMKLIRTLIAEDRRGNFNALARRMGVQGLIFNCKSWWVGMRKLGRYSYCYKPNGDRRRNLDRTQAHRDHVHIELNWPGARKRTSFWRSPVSR